MSSSIFEVRESESDSEKVLDYGLDTCEENGIMSTQIDGELPKDHTYTKEPDVMQEGTMGDSDHSSNQAEEMDDSETPAGKSKSPRAIKSRKTPKKSLGKGKPKRNVVKKEIPVSKKGKTKKDDISEEVNAIAESVGNGQITDTIAEASNAAEEDSKSSKRGRKRKIEEKENVEDEGAQNATEDSSVDDSEKSPKKKSAPPVKTPRAKTVNKGKVVEPADDIVDHHNLPKGWIRKSVVRKSGKSAGQIDVYIYSPDGFKFRSKPDIASYLARTKSNLNLDDFDFSKKSKSQNATSVSSTTKQAPKKKPVAAKPKTPIKKKSKPASPKKSAKLLVKIVSAKPRKSRATKESPEKDVKESKSQAKGRARKAPLKSNKKKTNA